MSLPTDAVDVLHVTVEIRRQRRRPDGTLDPRREFVRTLSFTQAQAKIEEAYAGGERSLSVLIIGRPVDPMDAQVQGLPS